MQPCDKTLVAQAEATSNLSHVGCRFASTEEKEDTTTIQYTDLAEKLTPEARELFSEMVAAHLEAGSGDRRFLRSDTMGGTGLHFYGPDSSEEWRGFDGGAIEDLKAYGLLHVSYSSKGSQSYRVSGEAISFYRWLMQVNGSPVTHVEEAARSLVAGEQFAADHPQAAHHLGQAFDLLWSDRTDAQTLSEIGDHLRKAIMDLVSDVLDGDVRSTERPIDELRRYMSASTSELGEREASVLRSLVDLAASVLHLDHRLNHIRDETDKGLPSLGWGEARRAAFTTAFVCYELALATRK